MRLAPTLFAAALAWSALAPPRPAHAAETTRPVVVELFTSQGCSSCPPADAVLLDLARSRADVLPLAFHVTYWNGLGWRDPFSSEAATARQRAYGRALGLEGVYTPQVVVNGHVDVVGSDRPAVLRAIQRVAAEPGLAGLSVTRAGGAVRVDGSAGAGSSLPATVWLVAYDEQRRTAVGRGENGGRTLLEGNIVRSIEDIGTWRGGSLHLERPLPEGERLAVLVQDPDGRIIGAAREARPNG